MHYDLIVIGAGPGGYVAAIRARQLGLRVALIDKESVGGTCLNWGCIPTKALLHCADVYRCAEESKNLGISYGSESPTVDFAKVMSYARSVIGKMSGGLSNLLQQHGVEVIKGTAFIANTSQYSDSIGKSVKIVEVRIENNDINHSKIDHGIKNNNCDRGHSKDDLKENLSAVTTNSITISTDNIIIATGASPRNLPNIEIDGRNICTSRDLLELDSLPKSLLIVGSGAIGMEFASFYSTFGAKVHVIEIQDRILPTEDREIAQMAHDSFSSQGIDILTRFVIDEIRLNCTDNDAIAQQKMHTVVLRNLESGEKQEIVVERVLVATGVVPSTIGLGIENTKINLSKAGFIETNQYMQTSESGVYAIGDVRSPPCLAHKASHEGILAVNVIASTSASAKEDCLSKHIAPINEDRIPGCIYSHPQIASVGLTESQAIERNIEFSIGRFPFAANGKSVAINEKFGMIKVLIEKEYGEIIGAHMIGSGVSELIGNFVLAMNAEMTAESWLESIFPHPTISESLSEAVSASLGLYFHIPPKK